MLPCVGLGSCRSGTGKKRKELIAGSLKSIYWKGGETHEIQEAGYCSGEQQEWFFCCGMPDKR